MKKLTTNEFITKSKLVHGDKYDYSRCEYKTIKEKIQLICPIHGEFKQSAEKHLLGSGCILCGKEKYKQTILDKYGVTNVFETDWCKEKRKNTLITKYGVDSPIKNKEIFNKIKKTNVLRYGVDNPFKSVDIINNKILPKRNYITIREKSKQTCIEKYGVDNYFKTNIGKQQIKLYHKDSILNDIFNGTRLKNKVIPLFNENDYIDVQTKYKFKCNTCYSNFNDNLDDGKIPRCPTCFPYIKDSKVEYEIIDFLKTLCPTENINHGNRKVLNGLELDIYIPNLNLAIEFNGLYYHSEITGNKNKNYHLNKTLLCDDKNIHLIHLFENEWRLNKENIKLFIENLIKNNSIKNEMGIVQNNNILMLDRRFYNTKYLLKENLKLIEILSPTKLYVDKQHTNIINTESDDWVWNCGYFKCENYAI